MTAVCESPLKVKPPMKAAKRNMENVFFVLVRKPADIFSQNCTVVLFPSINHQYRI
jgi:hypothetical protein